MNANPGRSDPLPGNQRNPDDMNRFLKFQNIAFAALFGVAGIIALIVAICGKRHQFVMAAICMVAVAVLVIECK